MRLVLIPAGDFLMGSPGDDKFTVEIATNASDGPHLIRVFNEQGASAPRFLIVTREPQAVEREPNDDYSKPQRVDHLPVSLNGRLDKSGDVDSFAVTLEAGQTLIASIEAYTLASPVDAVLRLVDSRGVQVALNHDDGRTLDPFLAWTAKTAGTYVLQVFGFAYPATSDVNFTGGAACVYRLHLSRGPYLGYTLPLGVQRGKRTTLRLFGWNLASDLGREFEFDGSSLSADQRQAVLQVPGIENALTLPAVDGVESIEKEPNDSASEATQLDLPVAVVQRRHQALFLLERLYHETIHRVVRYEPHEQDRLVLLRSDTREASPGLSVARRVPVQVDEAGDARPGERDPLAASSE
jgi:hypothetical protein